MTTEPAAHPCALPTQSHRIAADRAMRLAAHAGPGEALELYDELSAGERRIVFAMLARAAGRRTLPPLPADRDAPWWTSRELEAAEAAVVAGARAPWLMVGARIFRAQTRRTARATRTLAAVRGE